MSMRGCELENRLEVEPGAPSAGLDPGPVARCVPHSVWWYTVPWLAGASASSGCSPQSGANHVELRPRLIEAQACGRRAHDRYLVSRYLLKRGVGQSHAEGRGRTVG